MKWSWVGLTCLVLGAILFSAGCLQEGNTSATPPTRVTALQGSPLAGFALSENDAPVNYTMVTNRAKTPDEVGGLAKELGWESGYVVEYSGLPDHPMGPTTITQSITTYPSANMPKIAELIETNDKADRELVITALPSPALGENSRAFSGKAGAQIVLRPDKEDPLASGSLKGSFKQDIVEIIFTKGSTLEVLRMTGPHADYATLLALAEKAYAIIP